MNSPKPPSPEHIDAVAEALMDQYWTPLGMQEGDVQSIAKIAVNASKAFEREQRRKKRDLSHCKHRIPAVACVQCDT